MSTETTSSRPAGKRRIRFRTWYLALAGILLQAIAGVVLLLQIPGSGQWEGFFLVVFAIFVLMAAALGIVPLVLLAIPRTRRIGGGFSIFFGVIGLAMRFGMIVGILLIVAGAIAVWKKI